MFLDINPLPQVAYCVMYVLDTRRIQPMTLPLILCGISSIKTVMLAVKSQTNPLVDGLTTDVCMFVFVPLTGLIVSQISTRVDDVICSQFDIHPLFR